MTPDQIALLDDDLLAVCAAMLSPAGWQPVEGHPALFLRSNMALLSALRCTLTTSSVTVASASMTFEEDRPLQITVQPRGRDGFAAVCDLFGRHAGALDRLDYEACVADLLRYVPEVHLECETSGLIPTVARVSRGAIVYEPAPPPAWPPPERARAALNQRRRAGDDAALLAWEPGEYKALSRIVSKDRRRNLSERIASYVGRQLLRQGDSFVRTIEGGRHAVWMPPDDSKGAFAFSIGLGYLHDLPEVLLISPMPAMIGATSRALALTVNAVAAAMIGGVRLSPGDRYAAVADTVARTVHKECTLDHASLAQSCFVIPSARIEERTLGAARWFYANFMDTTTFPVLACLLQPPRLPESYGVPPPPPPAKRKAAAAVRQPKRTQPKKAAKKPARKAAVKKAVKKSARARPRRR